MKKNVALFCIFALILFSGCSNNKRELETIVDITKHQIHKGKHLGDAYVYVINFVEDTYEPQNYHPVYELEDGSYIINYLGEDYVLSKLDDPIVLPGCEYTKVNWKFDCNYYIKEIPN